MTERQFERACVKFFNAEKGWGFLSRITGHDVFVHGSVLKRCGIRAEEMTDDREVEIMVMDGPKGLKAEEVRLV